MQKTYIFWVVFGLIGIITGIGIYKFGFNSFDKNLACTKEAKICPDGSAVGRTGPNCEFAACPQAGDLVPPNGNSLDSGVEGVVTLGPTCPVEREGDISCADKPYSTTIEATSVGKSSTFVTTESNAKGEYKIILPPGEYVLEASGGSVLPRCEAKNIKIEKAKIIKVNLSCDSGIR